MRKTSCSRVLRLERKCRALWGPIGGACTRPLCSPQNPTMAQKGIIFSEKDAAGVPAQAGWCPCGLGSEPFSCPRSWLAPGWWMWGSWELPVRPGTGEGDRPMRHCRPKSQMRKQAGRQCPAPRAGSRGHPWAEGAPGGWGAHPFLGEGSHHKRGLGLPGRHQVMSTRGRSTKPVCRPPVRLALRSHTCTSQSQPLLRCPGGPSWHQPSSALPCGAGSAGLLGKWAFPGMRTSLDRPGPSSAQGGFWNGTGGGRGCLLGRGPA